MKRFTLYCLFTLIWMAAALVPPTAEAAGFGRARAGRSKSVFRQRSVVKQQAFAAPAVYAAPVQAQFFQKSYAVQAAPVVYAPPVQQVVRQRVIVQQAPQYDVCPAPAPIPAPAPCYDVPQAPCNGLGLPPGAAPYGSFRSRSVFRGY